MTRHYRDWLEKFTEYASVPGEAPKRMYFWAGVSAVAGALRRKVWIEQFSFRWYSNMYIVFVAPPGVVSKSTTSDVAIKLLRRIEGIKFGPDVVTWQALLTAFTENAESFELNGEYHTMSALTLEASEFGNLLNPQDREMVDIYVRLWDAKESPFEKKTKHSGNDSIQKPWINMIACTTPAWIAGNFPEYMIGGGFTSRCVFVYADEKEKLVPYPDEIMPPDHLEVGNKLVEDLQHIAMNFAGPFQIHKDAREYGRRWYLEHYSKPNLHLDQDRFGGYLARKQTIIHKLAMILNVCRSDSMLIEECDLALADAMVTDLEKDMAMVFARIGQTDIAATAQRLINYIHTRKWVPYEEAFRFVHAQIPSMREFDDVLQGAARSGQVGMIQKTEGVGSRIWLYGIDPATREPYLNPYDKPKDNPDEKATTQSQPT
jgi:hypothetical protein